MAARRAAGEKIVRLDPLEKARRKPTSLRLAITAKCYDCMGRDGDPGIRARVRECPSKACPLHPVRPWQREDGSGEELELEGDESTEG